MMNFLNMINSLERKMWLIFGFVFFLNCIVWGGTRYRVVEWLNVPPVPSEKTVLISSLGDRQVAYRSLAIMLQNLGDMGGRVTPINDYNFDRLAQWFFLMDELDNQSDYIPYLAAFYFGAAHGDQAKEKLIPLVKYLHKVGNSAEGQKWRWLVHGVYLARFKIGDLDWAYDMSVDLARIAREDRLDLPHWVRKMPVFILNEKGDKEAALSMMLGILSSKGETLPPSEVNYIRYYVCEQILDTKKAREFALCNLE